MECVNHLVRAAEENSWSAEELATRRTALQSAIARSKADSAVQAIFMHGPEAVQVRLEGNGSVIELFSMVRCQWLIQKESGSSLKEIRIAIEDARTWYPRPRHPISLSENQFLRNAMLSDEQIEEAIIRQECRDLCRAHLEGGGRKASVFVLSLADRFEKTESNKMRLKGEAIRRLCDDASFIAELEQIQQECDAAKEVLPLRRPGS